LTFLTTSDIIILRIIWINFIIYPLSLKINKKGVFIMNLSTKIVLSLVGVGVYSLIVFGWLALAKVSSDADDKIEEMMREKFKDK